MTTKMVRCLTMLFLGLSLAACQTQSGSSNTPSPNSNISVAEGGTSNLLAKSWQDTPVPFFISKNVPDRLVAPILDSFSRWEQAAGKKMFDYQGRADSTQHSYDGQNVVYWDKNPNPKGFLGETFFMTLGKDDLMEADIVFFGNPEQYSALECPSGASHCTSNAGKYDVTTTALHEIGHFLGFEHSHAAGDIMNPDFGMDSVIHNLDANLVAQLQGLYNPTTMASK